MHITVAKIARNIMNSFYAGKEACFFTLTNLQSPDSEIVYQ